MYHSPHFARLGKDWGIHFAQDTRGFLPPEYRSNFSLACDAQPALATVGSAGIPTWFTLYHDPEVVRVLQSPNNGADILGERKMGDWTTETAMFNVIENTGEVSSYGDWNENGRSDANVTFPQRQSYHFQTIIEYGDRQIARAGEAKLDWVSELQRSSALTLDKFMDLTYHNGVAGLQNYGLLNDPSLSAAMTPITKAAAGAGTKWVNNNAVVATANEVMIDIQSLFSALVNQTNGRVSRSDAMTLALSPQSEVGLTAINSFGIDVGDLVRKEFPNLRVKTSPRYATGSGNVVQLIADSFDGMKTGYCAFTEKMRDHAIVRALSSYKQKKTSGTFGAVIRYPLAITQMTGV